MGKKFIWGNFDTAQVDWNIVPTNPTDHYVKISDNPFIPDIDDYVWAGGGLLEDRLFLNFWVEEDPVPVNPKGPLPQRAEVTKIRMVFKYRGVPDALQAGARFMVWSHTPFRKWMEIFLNLDSGGNIVLGQYSENLYRTGGPDGWGPILRSYWPRMRFTYWDSPGAGLDIPEPADPPSAPSP